MYLHHYIEGFFVNILIRELGTQTVSMIVILIVYIIRVRIYKSCGYRAYNKRVSIGHKKNTFSTGQQNSPSI